MKTASASPRPDLGAISKVILGLCKTYRRTHGMSPAQINDGLCDQFAGDAMDKLPVEVAMEARVVWLADLYHPPIRWKEMVNHAVVLYRGYYFDSETPQGVPAVCPMLLPAWRRADCPVLKMAA
jgi:hypothetical protein